MNSIKPNQNRSLYPTWPETSERFPGYTLLLLIPADLPVFLKIAMQVIGQQVTTNCRETIVVPDHYTPKFDSYFEEYKQFWKSGPIRMERLGPIEDLVARKADGHARCWMQIVRGVAATQTEYAIWHDADAFILKPDFFESLYDRCSTEQLSCLGVNHVWNIDTFAKHGFDRINATWEMTINVPWMQQWPPKFHLGQMGDVNGEELIIDILIAAQMQTPPKKLGRIDLPDSYIHFNYVICDYRRFQNTETFGDDFFRILLVRLLIDAFDQGNESYEVPHVNDLERGIYSSQERVTYTSPVAVTRYPEFRARIDRLLTCGLLSLEQSTRMRQSLQPFDRAFASNKSLNESTIGLTEASKATGSGV